MKAAKKIEDSKKIEKARKANLAPEELYQDKKIIVE